MSKGTRYILLGLAATVLTVVAVVVLVVLFAGKGPGDSVKEFLTSVASQRVADADGRWLESSAFTSFVNTMNENKVYIREFKINSVTKKPNEKVIKPGFKVKYYGGKYESTGKLADEGDELDSTKDDLEYTKSDLDDQAAYYPTMTPEEQAQYNQDKAKYESDLQDYNTKLAEWQSKEKIEAKKWQLKKDAYEKDLAKNTLALPCAEVDTIVYGTESSQSQSMSKTVKFTVVKYRGGWKIYEEFGLFVWR